MLAERFKRVRGLAWRVMKGIFENMWDYKYVPVEIISRDSGVEEHKVERILKSLSDERLVEVKQTEYLGGAFTFLGLSLYSLYRFVRRDLVTMLGEKMGEGKESMIYNCMSKWGEAVLKFHKVGYTSFKKVREKRDYGNLHYTVLMVRSAKNEFNALKKVYGKVSVPKPYGWEGNAVLMELVDAKELYKVKLENPKEVLDYIIEEVREMWKLGIVHGDLSQFNILVNPEGIWFIDFPQAIDLSEIESDEELKVAEDILRRDLTNLLNYFRKTYGIDVNVDRVIEEVIKS
jgi:RIO kinase 2